MIQTSNAVSVEFFNFFWQDGTASTTKNLDVAGAFFLQEIIHVFEVLNVPALVRGHGNGIGIFLDGCIHYLLNGTVVTEVYNLTSGTLNDATHDVNGCIMTVKKRSCSDDAYLVFWYIWSWGIHGSVMYLGP